MTRTFDNENSSSIIKAEEMVFTPFGPTPSQGRGYKMKGKVGSNKGYQASSSDQNKSSSLLDLSLLSNSYTVASPSLKYSSTQNSVESDQTEYQYVAFQQQSENSESVQYKQQEQNTFQSEQIQHQNVIQEQQHFSMEQQQSYSENESNYQEKVIKDFHQQAYSLQKEEQLYSKQEFSRKEEALEKIETASPKSYNQSPFSFKRPTAFNKANGSFGSFGSQLNLASMKEENTLFKMKNVEEMYNRNCTQQALQSSEANLHLCEDQSVQNSSQTMNELKMFSTTTKCSELFSQESESYESSSYRIAQNSLESKSTNIAESNEGLTYSNDVLDERDHFSAVCRYETSTKSCNDDKDMCQADIERDDENEEDIEDDVKEYSVEAKIIVNPNTGEKEVTTWDNDLGHEIIRDKTVYKTESNCKDRTEKTEKSTQDNSDFMNEVMSLGLVQQNFNSTEFFGQSQHQILTEESLNQGKQIYEQGEICEEEYEKMEESEMHMNEEKVEYSRENEDVKDYSELFIKEEQKTVINSCIEELEKSTVIDSKTESILNGEKEYEDVNFQTEKIIDTEDLEHVHVKSYKNEERRLSFQHQTQTDEIIQMCEQVGNIIEEKMMTTCSMDSNMTTTTTSTELKDESIRVNVDENLLEENTIQTDVRESKSTEEHQDHVGSDEMSSSFFLTETDDTHRSQTMNKRQRNRTIDYHNLPSLYWEASVQNYHEKKFTQNTSEIVTESITENVSHEVQTEDNVQNDSNLAKDGLSIILQK